MARKRFLFTIALLLPIAFVQQASAQAPGGQAPAQAPDGPKYDGNKLIFPDGFRTSWMFVGSNDGLQYKGEGATVLKDGHPLTAPRLTQTKASGTPVELHNVYITPEGYAGFRTSQTAFPDRTVLVIDRYLAQQKEPHNILSAGSFDGDQYGALVAVKDSSHPQPSGPGKTDWSYYIFSADEIAKPGAEEPVPDAKTEAACIACHKKNGLVDNVWVQFYPMLRVFLHPGN